MRVTQQTKANTRAAILREAAALFAGNGFDATSTRDIAAATGLATGTLFNYFPSKEAVAHTLVREALDAAPHDDPAAASSPEEAVFAIIAAQLRALRPLKAAVAPSLAALLAADPSDGPWGTDGAASALRHHGLDPDEHPATLHLFRALHAGVLSFWLRDASPGQEDTLAMLDRATRAFVSTLRPPPKPGGAQ